MLKKHIFWNKIDNWLGGNKYVTNKIIKRILAVILKINIRTIVLLNVRNRCVNVFTSSYLYKCQLYGNNIKKDLENRKLFSAREQSVISPIKVYKKMPRIVIMPILKRPIKNEAAACYILDKLKGASYETAFRTEDYPFIMNGLNLLKDCNNGKKVSEKLFKFLQRQRGVIVRVGIVHGDFHRDNIMCKGSMPVLIDFDCSRKNDIQAIDALYYILEEVRHKNGYKKSWLEEWLLIYENINIMYEYRCIEQVDIDLKFGLIILLLERISQDQHYNYSFIDENKKNIKKISHKLMSEKHL